MSEFGAETTFDELASKDEPFRLGFESRREWS